MMKRVSLSLLAMVAGAEALAQENTAQADAGVTAIMNATVHTISGDVIENGDVIIRDGRIAAIGPDLEAPAGANVIDASGKVVTPGVIAPLSALGLAEINLDAEANDISPDDDFPLGAALDAVDAFNPSSTLIAVNRAGGVTRAFSSPSAGSSLFAGRGAVVDLSGAPSSVTKPQAAQTVVMGYSGAARAGDTRLGSWAVLRETLDEAAAYAANPFTYPARAREDRFAIADLKALGPVLRGDQPLIVYVYSANEIRNLIRLKNDYRLNVIIAGGTEAWVVAAELAEARIPVILNPMANLPAQFEDLNATLKNAARLVEAGVSVGFFSPASGSHNLRALTQQAGNAVAHGLEHDAALAALTLWPAQMLGINGDLGSIDVGKIADIVVWSGDPLELTSYAEAVFINGAAQSLENRQTMLRDRYRYLSRGDLPHAYRGGE
ncbi:MAG: amidohydrolase family protein [Pseudomonadota bacterium]